MDFDFSPKVQDLRKQVSQFMEDYVYPNEKTFEDQLNSGPDRWQIPPIIEELKEKAKAAGLWNLFLPESEYGYGLTNLEYAPLSEIMGRVHWGSEVFNCSAPDTGNMEVLSRYGTPEQQKEWLEPLLEGKIRSCFAMTEPAVASSDATNIESRIVRDGDEYVINGRKWWSSGMGDPRCKILIFMGKTDPDNPNRYLQQSQILIPCDTPGVNILRMLSVFGYDDAPHGHGRGRLGERRQGLRAGAGELLAEPVYRMAAQIQAERLLHQRQIESRILVVAQVGVDRKRHVPLPERRHERRPVVQHLSRNRPPAVGEHGLLHQVDLAHPREDAWVFLLQAAHFGEDGGGARQIGKRHRHRQMDARGCACQVSGGVGDIVLGRRRQRCARTVQVVGAGREVRKRLADAVDVRE